MSKPKPTMRIESLLDKEGEYVGVFCAGEGYTFSFILAMKPEPKTDYTLFIVVILLLIYIFASTN
jgi:hypothetical protein